MRLLDAVSACRSPIVVANDDGSMVILPGADRFAERVRACPQRFILDPGASEMCHSFLSENAARIAPSDPFVRAPMRSFWLEWWAPRPEDTPGSMRIGAYFEGDADGRSGALRSFWEEDWEIAISAGWLRFSLDGSPPAADGLGVARLSHPDFPALFAHAWLDIDPEWLAYFSRHGRQVARDAVRRVAEGCWVDLPFMLAFATLLGLKTPFQTRPSELTRLNNARRKQGRAALLDHIEVALALERVRDGGAAGDSVARLSPRLHLVRGHVVKRGEHLFWRTAHLRGAVGGAPLRRTVKVKAG